MTYDEPLDEESVPPESAFTVTGGNRARRVSEVAVAGRAVVLTLDPEAEPGEAGIQVSYRVPTGTGMSPVRDEVGNEAAELSKPGGDEHHETEGSHNRDQFGSGGQTGPTRKEKTSG